MVIYTDIVKTTQKGPNIDSRLLTTISEKELEDRIGRETTFLGRGYAKDLGSEDNCKDASYVTTKFKITISVQI